MKLALVTGGYRRIGGCIAMRLAREGWTLALHSHRAAQAEGALAEALHGTGWCGFVTDLADPAEAAGLIGRVIAAFGQAPGLLVNSASRFEDDDAGRATIETMAAHHAVNAAAPVALALALARAGGMTSVVNILDQRVRNPNRDQLSYTLSKTALAAATRTLAVALAPNVRVNAVAPGLTLPTGDYDAAQLARLASLMPLARLPSPDDIADAVLYFATAQSVTGQTLFVDAGASLKSFERDFVYL